MEVFIFKLFSKISMHDVKNFKMYFWNFRGAGAIKFFETLYAKSKAPTDYNVLNFLSNGRYVGPSRHLENFLSHYLVRNAQGGVVT